MFGISNNNEFNSLEIVESLRDKFLLSVFKFPAFSFKRVAFLISPDLNKPPISFANLFDSERISSRLDCVDLLSLSVSIILLSLLLTSIFLLDIKELILSTFFIISETNNIFIFL